jgi:hypothetical protein
MDRRIMDRRFSWALAVLMFASFLGCTSKVTPDNYDRIKGGMTIAEVEALLGPGQEEKTPAHLPDAKALRWRNGDFTIKVEFRDGKVYGHEYGKGTPPPG